MIREPQFRNAAAKEPHKYLVEISLNLLKRLPKCLRHIRVYLLDDALYIFLRLLKVVNLCFFLCIARFLFRVFLDGVGVDRAECVDGVRQLIETFVQYGFVNGRNLLRCSFRRHAKF